MRKKFLLLTPLLLFPFLTSCNKNLPTDLVSASFYNGNTLKGRAFIQKGGYITVSQMNMLNIPEGKLPDYTSGDKIFVFEGFYTKNDIQFSFSLPMNDNYNFYAKFTEHDRNVLKFEITKPTNQYDEPIENPSTQSYWIDMVKSDTPITTINFEGYIPSNSLSYYIEEKPPESETFVEPKILGCYEVSGWLDESGKAISNIVPNRAQTFRAIWTKRTDLLFSQLNVSVDTNENLDNLDYASISHIEEKVLDEVNKSYSFKDTFTTDMKEAEETKWYDSHSFSGWFLSRIKNNIGYYTGANKKYEDFSLGGCSIPPIDLTNYPLVKSEKEKYYLTAVYTPVRDKFIYDEHQTEYIRANPKVKYLGEITLPTKEDMYEDNRITQLPIGVAPNGFSYTNLTSVNLANHSSYEDEEHKTQYYPSTITEIGENAFKMCSFLNTVILPSTVDKIDITAFHCSGKIDTFDVVNEKGETHQTSSGGYYVHNNSLYQKLGNLITLIRISTNDHDIENDTSIISYGAFSDNDLTTSYTLPSTVVSVGDSAFENCRALTSISFEHTGFIPYQPYMFSGIPRNFSQSYSKEDKYYIYLNKAYQSQYENDGDWTSAHYNLAFR